MLIMSKAITNRKATKRMLSTKFNMKDLGVAGVILGIKILKTPNGLALPQIHFIQKILEKFNFFKF